MNPLITSGRMRTLYLTGTSEVALAGLHQGEILPAEELPLRYAGYSTCFRREAGAAGRLCARHLSGPSVRQGRDVRVCDTRALARDDARRKRVLGRSKIDLASCLGLAYRVMVTHIAAGDLGPSASKKYDIEAWIPSQERYREITSCSNTTDFQTRRLGGLNCSLSRRWRVVLRAHLERHGDDGTLSRRAARNLPRRTGRSHGLDVLVNCGAPRRLEKAG